MLYRAASGSAAETPSDEWEKCKRMLIRSL